MPPTPYDPLLPVFLDVLRRRRSLTFIYAEDLGAHCALTDLDNNITILNGRNTLGEMRSTMGHEFGHLLRPDDTEDQVEALAASWLVPAADALSLGAGVNVANIAERLCVDPAMVRARLRDLELPVERAG
jgi:Zn-dependent peptidase ImmA (M78 family)